MHDLSDPSDSSQIGQDAKLQNENELIRHRVMTINVLNQAQFDILYASKPSYVPGKIDPDAQAKVQEVVESVVGRSSTAREIWRDLNSCTNEINIIVWRDWRENDDMLYHRDGAGASILTNTAFGNDEPTDGKGVVFWCPYLSYSFLSENGAHPAASDAHSGQERTSWEAPNSVVLFHEFGHARQWATRPEFYLRHAQKSRDPAMKAIRAWSSFGSEIKTLFQKVAERDWNSFNPADFATEAESALPTVTVEALSEAVTSSSSAPPPPPMPGLPPLPIGSSSSPSSGGGLPQPGGIPPLPMPLPRSSGPNVRSGGRAPAPRPQRIQDLAYFFVIEQDNMFNHEWPICRDLGVETRLSYADIDCPTARAVFDAAAERLG